MPHTNDHIIATESTSTAIKGQLPRFPEGWYCLGLSRELKKGDVKPIKAFDQELVLFRNESGTAVVLDAYCPHLGAHMGFGGTVVGDNLRCPFHGYHFSTSGQCVKTDYGTGVPQKTCTKSWHVDDKNGFIMVFYSPLKQSPDWHIPAFDYSDFTPLKSHTFQLAAHVQDVNENSVDLGHFDFVHGYDRIDIDEKPTTEGKAMYAAYSMVRDTGLVGYKKPFKQSLQIQVHGMGFSHVDVSIPDLGLAIRAIVMTTPIDAKTTELRIANTVSKRVQATGMGKYLQKIPTWALMPALNWILHKAYIIDVSQDLDIWEHKIYLENPALMKGDGPINFYRKYCRQFYNGASSKTQEALKQKATTETAKAA
ncbi:3-ketosteroid-9-alpha-monooxygenase, oxygenase component [BD1-7 clade bacterium]|uniref:cholesterol 7-desaturase n=1 Tax=BD1-7 clade bacterium TaxID=2029982 RepID=A0A5S9PN59_9GAMM|nr:3-ketosteroid-9-alpha-monooxygenase, oxygenase component [BD1-7 clade bacterium]